MHIAKFRRVGGSVMVAVPPAFLDQLNLAPGSSVSVELDHGRLVLAPRLRPRYTHAELLAMGPPPEPTPEDIAWEATTPIGSEII